MRLDKFVVVSWLLVSSKQQLTLTMSDISDSRKNQSSAKLSSCIMSCNNSYIHVHTVLQLMYYDKQKIVSLLAQCVTL